MASGVTILVPTFAEAKPLAKSLGFSRDGESRFTRGPATLHVIGLRAARLADVPAGEGRVILAGVGGGLDPSLKIGSVVVDSTAATASLGVCVGRIVCSHEAVCSPAEKAALFARTSAVAVDMESDAVRARWPEVLHVRAILDEGGEALPRELLGLVDERGRTRGGAVAGLLARKPYLVPALARVGRAQGKAMGTLSRVLRLLLDGEG